MAATSHLAIDLGAESGRAMVGTVNDGRLSLREVYRFRHQPVRESTGLHWDFDGIVGEVWTAIRRAVEQVESEGQSLDSIGVDTWGVDFGLISAEGDLLGLPHAYRDERNQVAFESVQGQLDFDRLYARTGIQPMSINTLIQLVATHDADPEILARAHRLLFMPDLLHGVITGRSSQSPVERSIASTSQMIDPETGAWAVDVLDSLGLPSHFLAPIEGEASDRGAIRADARGDLGIDEGLRVVTPAAHDTASAVAAVPALDDRPWCYLSSGTWSLLGAELERPCRSEAARRAPFTNELGVGGSVRFQKNIIGLWLLQECRRDWASGGSDRSYADLVADAEQVASHRILLDPDHPPFAQPGDMIRKIERYCEITAQPAPRDSGSIVRACLESLALEYRRTHEQLCRVLNRPFGRIHLVGGGARNRLLAQMTADATRAEVVVGPFEATATGSVLIQALRGDAVSSPAEIRRVVARSYELEVLQPRDPEEWDRSYVRYLELVQG